MTGAGRRTPLVVLACLLAAIGPVATTVVVAAVQDARGRLTAGALLAILGAGITATVGAVAAVGFVLARVAGALRRIERGALVDTAAPPDLGTTREVAGLAAAVAALRARVRIADEVADRHRAAASDAAAGVFRLVSGLVAAEEGARGQLSAELHDTVAQSLLSARMLLADGEVGRAHEAVDEAEEQVRALMARTRPPELRDGDLAGATAALRDELARRYGLRVAIEWPRDERPLPLSTAVVVYRFFQEALLNVVKHADVDEAAVMLAFPEDGAQGLCASVADRGAGFVRVDTPGSGGRHVGLSLMAERARLAGGSVELVSRPGLGTTVTLTLPAAALGAQLGSPLSGAGGSRR